MAQTRSSFFTSQLVMGLILVGLGILFLLDRLEIIEASQVLRLWPAVLVVLGLMKLFQSRSTPGRFFGFILAGGGTLLLLNRIEYIPVAFSFRDLVVLVLIGLGISFIWSSLSSKKKGAMTLEESEDAASFINSFALLGGISRKNNSKNFQGGELSAILGGVELDLTEAHIEDEAAVITVFTFWGGIEIKILDNWKVEIDGHPILGGISDETKSSVNTDTKELIVRGYAIMGGVEITN